MNTNIDIHDGMEFKSYENNQIVRIQCVTKVNVCMKFIEKSENRHFFKSRK